MKKIPIVIGLIMAVILLSGIAVMGEEPAVDSTWISPGKVVISNFYPGARAEYPISVHNGKDTEATFSVTYRIPNREKDGYIRATHEQESWVIIADMTPVIAPQSTEEILIILDMPSDAVAPGSRWEFWISVVDATQGGMVVTELCSRWLVNMRVSRFVMPVWGIICIALAAGGGGYFVYRRKKMKT